jgi:hypothetical protein
MEHNDYHHSSIVKIDTEKIYYKDKDNVVQTIDFYECRKNWVRHLNESDDFQVTNLAEDETRCVGWRDIFHSPSYIEFFSEPRIRFVFHDRRSILEWVKGRKSSKGRRHFLSIQYKIKEAGWTTYDLG